MRWRAALGGWALAALPGGGAPQGRVAQPVEHLTLTLPALEGLAPAGDKRWRGSLGPSRVEITFNTLASARYAFDEPEDVLEVGPSFWRSPDQARNDPARRRARAGAYGFASYAAWERSELRVRAGNGPSGVRFLLASLLPEAGYWITVEATPAPEDEAPLLAFLESGIAWSGPVREHRWTDEEARARFLREAPESAHARFEPPLRTAHYIVLTDSPGGASFGRRMEQCFEEIRALYPFDDVPGRRLLPVFLFRTSTEYWEYHARQAGIDLEDARRSRGSAWRDAYATWNEASGERVHLHEATHQIFANRLGLAGGGSWFQEGVAEYLSTRPGERAAAAGRVKRGEHVPLAEFVVIPSLTVASAAEAPGTPTAGDLHAQAALLLEFLRESEWARDEFPLFLARMGRAPPSLAGIAAVFEEVYGLGLDGIEARWVEYCRQR